MLCTIADLLVDIPTAGGMPPRLKEYLSKEQGARYPDIFLKEERYEKERYPENTPYDVICYMESGRLFHGQLLRHNGIMLHASAVAYQGKAYLFSGPCGMGKSTHTRLWQQVFGPAARVFNDDKPVLRLIDGTWYAYGTPWSGKHHININMKAPLAGICFMKQEKENKIHRLTPQEAVFKILWQTHRRYRGEEAMRLVFQNVDALVEKIPVFELENNAAPECAHLSYETMCKSAEEAGL